MSKEVAGGTRSNPASSRTSRRVDSVREGECWIVTDCDTTEAWTEVGGGDRLDRVSRMVATQLKVGCQCQTL